MVRMLCDDPRSNNPEHPEFRKMGVATLESALSNLQRIDFGLSEDMSGALEIARTQWSVPYALHECRQNATAPGNTGDDLSAIPRIMSLNAFDLTLYECARRIFRERYADLKRTSGALKSNASCVFNPEVGK